MRPAHCNAHAAQSFVPTSPLLAALVEKKKGIGGEEVCKIRIRSFGRDFEILVDRQFFGEFFDASTCSEVILVDRDREQNKLNDRLLIQKITSRLQWVCPVCLQQLEGRKACRARTPAPLPQREHLPGDGLRGGAALPPPP